MSEQPTAPGGAQQALTVRRAYKYELDLNNKERTLCLRYAGAARWVWNWGLARKLEAREKGLKAPGFVQLHKELVRLKHSELPWLWEVSRCVPARALWNLEVAFRGFFAGRTRLPRFKSRKRGIGGFYVHEDISAQGHRVRLPRLGWLRVKQETKVDGRILSATVKERAGRWFVAIHVEREIIPPTNEGPSIGVDLGINRLATMSDESVENNRRPLKGAQKRLRRLQRRLCRQKKGSGRRERTKRRLAKLHYRIACVRNDCLHKLTTRLAKNHGRVGVEDLNVRGMVVNRCLAQAIGDAAFGEFRRQLTYKCQWYGSELVVHDRFFPSSKTCSGCGAVKADLTLDDRVYRCEACGLEIDRDLNAARNLCPLDRGRMGVEGRALTAGSAGRETGPAESPTEHRTGG